MTSTFTQAEIAYLRSQRLARLATVGADGRPHVAPIGVHYDPAEGTVVVHGRNLAASKKFRDARQNPEVAYLVDDLASIDPWTPRGIEVRVRAELHEDGPRAWMVIRPRRVLSWGLDTGPFELVARDVEPPRRAAA